MVIRPEESGRKNKKADQRDFKGKEKSIPNYDKLTNVEISDSVPTRQMRSNQIQRSVDVR